MSYPPPPQQPQPPRFGGLFATAEGAPPLNEPWINIPYRQAWIRFWRKGFTFTGRASRSEFWNVFFTLLGPVVVQIILGIIEDVIVAARFESALRCYSTGSYNCPLYHPGAGGFGVIYGIWTVLYWLWWLATIVPLIALGFRRMHDANREGPFFFIPIADLVFAAQPSDPMGARFDLGSINRPFGTGYPNGGYPQPGSVPPQPPTPTGGSWGSPPTAAGGFPPAPPAQNPFAPPPPTTKASAPPPPPPPTVESGPTASSPLVTPSPTDPPPPPAATASPPQPPAGINPFGPPPPPTAAASTTASPPPPPATLTPTGPPLPPPSTVNSFGPPPPPPATPRAAGPPPPHPATVNPAGPPPPPPNTRQCKDASNNEEIGLTRLSSDPAPAVGTEIDSETRRAAPTDGAWTLQLAGQRHIIVTTRAFIGRNPSAGGDSVGTLLIPITDTTFSVSKTHALIEVRGSELFVTDLASTNGSRVLAPDGTETALNPNAAHRVDSGSTVTFGDYVVTVTHNSPW